MRTRHSFVLFLVITFACAHVATSQQPRRRGGTRAARAAPPRASSRSAPQPARGPAWSITTQPFSEDGDATTLVSLQPMPTATAAGSQSPPVSFGVNFTYEGNRPAAFKNVALSFFSRSKSCRFAAEPAIVLNLDNRPLTLPFRPQAKGADGVFSVDVNDEGGDCSETVISYVSPATLARIAAARSVTGSIDKEKFQLTATNLAALRALLAQLNLPQLRAAPAARPRPRR